MIPWTSLKLCPNYAKTEEGCSSKQCLSLHFCYDFMTKNVCNHENGSQCKEISDAETSDNDQRLLRIHNLDDLPMASLKKLYTVSVML